MSNTIYTILSILLPVIYPYATVLYIRNCKKGKVKRENITLITLLLGGILGYTFLFIKNPIAIILFGVFLLSLRGYGLYKKKLANEKIKIKTILYASLGFGYILMGLYVLFILK